ncbi:Thioesterase superfamily protein [Mycobacterium sp. THAF192]|nr:Thioesterase superfamily protein [Mycobacterium sp. THAF192]
MTPTAQLGSATSTWCMIGDPTSVETRFGLHDCTPTDFGGNRCSYLVPPWARDADGRIRVGALMVLADHILGELPYIRRPPRTWSLTAELTLDVVGDLSDVETLLAEAQTVTGGPEPFVQCRLTDGRRNLLAVGNTRCVYVPATADDPEAEPATDGAGHADATDIDQLLGLSYQTLSDGVQLTLADPGSWINGFGIMHGGVAACVTELAAAAAVGAKNRHLQTAHIHTSYLRPVMSDSPYVAVARPVHVGRSSAVVEVLGSRGSGELCTVSTLTARRPA